MTHYCPTCNKKYFGLERFCTKCGIELRKIPNACPANKTALCKDVRLADDDLFCPYCGSKTTYAIEKEEQKKDGVW